MSNIDLKRRTKIVATIGPATQSEEIITNLIKAGVTTFRLNFSHGDHKDHAERIKTIREVSKKLDIDIGILQDLQGPKIRLGRFKDGPVKVKKVIRDKNGIFDNESKLGIKKELGDVLWYISNLCTELNFNLEDVAIQNLEKLKLRVSKGKISGSGDER